MSILEHIQKSIDKTIVEKKSSEEEEKGVSWYINKFKDKMSGSTFATSIGWVDGIGKAITDKEKAKVLKGIMKYIDIPKSSDAKKYEKYKEEVQRKIKEYPWCKSVLK